MQDFEKLGAFYLGRTHDPKRPEGGDLLLYDSRDLTTHAVIVGMTGSGKTGLGIALLEEAAIDGIPAIAIDPKGDLGNLMLTFPHLAPSDFEPWVDDGEVARKGTTRAALAEATAGTWRSGLAEWGQGPERIARLREAADIAIYTPGSSAGLGLSLLRSLAAPPAMLTTDADAMQERLSSTVSGLLALLGIAADPIRSREHILLAKLIEAAWSGGRSLDLTDLIRQIQTPPFEQVGVLDLEAFYPSKARAELAMAVNNLLASPSFAAWMEGEPLDVARLLWTAEGKPRVSVLSIAHLSDAERMFFVTLLLGEVIAWMRRQPGTSSLRAILYMDEIFGFFPPTANPPSKPPMLTLLKQARAFGLGIVLSTQNPVDLDYKGLSNAGTWFLGRLQTERDKARVMDGLTGASASAGKSFDRAKYEAILSGLEARTFLMNDVHEDEPALFQTRWTLSYLRGPLTRGQITELMATRKAAVGSVASAESPAVRPSHEPSPPGTTAPAASVSSAEASVARPILPAEIREGFLAWRGSPNAGEALLYAPCLLAAAKLHYVDAKAGVDAWEDRSVLVRFANDTGEPLWDSAEDLAGEPDIEKSPREGSPFATLPAQAARPKSWSAWKKAFADHLYRTSRLALWRSPDAKLISHPHEREEEFIGRMQLAALERRDAATLKLKQRWAPKLARCEERGRRALERLEREKSQYSQQKLQTVVSVGATLLGAFLGRKAVSASTIGRATTAARGVGRAAHERKDVGTAEQQVAAARAEREALEAEFAAEVQCLEAAGSEPPARQTLEVKPRKADISVDDPVLAWAPCWSGPDGQRPAWK